MCMVSVIQQYAGSRVNPQTWTNDTFGLYRQILEAVEKLDAKLGEPDCEDPAKAAWMREVEARLQSLEHKNTKF